MTFTLWYQSNGPVFNGAIVALRNRGETPYETLVAASMADGEHLKFFEVKPGYGLQSFILDDYQVPKDQWVHLAISYDPGNSEYYVY